MHNEDPDARYRGRVVLGFRDVLHATGGRRPTRSGPIVPLRPSEDMILGQELDVRLKFELKVPITLCGSEDRLYPGEQPVQVTEHGIIPLPPTAKGGRWCRIPVPNSRFQR